MRRRSSFLILIMISVPTWCWHEGFFTPYNYFTAMRDIRNSKVQIISYGLPLVTTYQNRLDSLQRKHGFAEKSIGCLVSEPLINGIHAYNKIVERHLEKRNGKDWKKQYQEEIEAIIR